jgi:hypothetical protein
MANFTSGKFAKAICDRCGDKMKYLELKLEWTGLMVCEECFDPKDPLEFPTNFPIDPESLRNPRPDNDVEAGAGTIRVAPRIGSVIKGIAVECEIGNVTVTVV